MVLDFRGVTAIFGRPGVGKTTLAMRVAHSRASAGDKVLWVSLYEDKETFLRNAASLGYDMSKVEFWDMIFIRTDLILNQVVSAVSQGEYRLVVIDSISALVESLQSREYLTNVVYRTFRPAGVDLIGIAEEDSSTPFDYIADNLLRLELRIRNGVAERRMYVIKSRGRRAGYYVEFDIVEGRGVLFIDELPRPRPKGRWETEIEAAEALSPVRGGLVYLVTGRGATSLLASVAADLSKRGRRVLYRVMSRAEEPVASLIRKFGGEVKVQRVDPEPVSYFNHVKSLYESVAESDADVVVSDGVDAEFYTYGRKAFEFNKREIEELRRLGVAVFIGGERDWGLRHMADFWVSISGEEALVHGAGFIKRCTYKTGGSPQLLC